MNVVGLANGTLTRCVAMEIADLEQIFARNIKLAKNGKESMRMTESEALQILNISPKMKKEIPNLAEVYEVAVKALEKQIPKKIIYYGGNYKCPNCEKPAMTVTARKKEFCDFCGQKLDWE